MGLILLFPSLDLNKF